MAQDNSQEERLRKKALKGIERLTGKKSFDIPSFNDAHETTQEDAILALKHAEEEEGGQVDQG